QDQSEEAAAGLVQTAWDLGIRYFDTAPFYGFGRAERRLGAALQAWPRDSFVLSTKVGRLLSAGSEDWRDRGAADYPFAYDYSHDGVMRSFEASLQRLGLSRVDIVYVHDICGKVHEGRAGSEARIRELMETGGWRAVSDLRASGVVGAIGVGVNEWEPCARMLELADPDLFLLAGRYTLLEQEPLNALFPACLKRGVGIVVGGALNAGALTGGPLYDYAPAPKAITSRVALIGETCQAHGVSILGPALQFIAAHPAVVSLLTGAQTPAELSANVAAFTGPAPPAALWQALKAERLLHPDAPTPQT
ncbi:MAG TPA: aldo/keto reductase, partial [Caulobacteraceae bacterium]|nr:aldo/keto reductase [Caulobacteraceae bacterium]